MYTIKLQQYFPGNIFGQPSSNQSKQLAEWTTSCDGTCNSLDIQWRLSPFASKIYTFTGATLCTAMKVAKWKYIYSSFWVWENEGWCELFSCYTLSPHGNSTNFLLLSIQLQFSLLNDLLLELYSSSGSLELEIRCSLIILGWKCSVQSGTNLNWSWGESNCFAQSGTNQNWSWDETDCFAQSGTNSNWSWGETDCHLSWSLSETVWYNQAQIQTGVGVKLTILHNQAQIETDVGMKLFRTIRHKIKLKLGWNWRFGTIRHKFKLEFGWNWLMSVKLKFGWHRFEQTLQPVQYCLGSLHCFHYCITIETNMLNWWTQ